MSDVLNLTILNSSMPMWKRFYAHKYQILDGCHPLKYCYVAVPIQLQIEVTFLSLLQNRVPVMCQQ